MNIGTVIKTSAAIKFAAGTVGVCAVIAAGIALWAHRPIIDSDRAPAEFVLERGNGEQSSAGQIAAAGVPVNVLLFDLVARVTGKHDRLKAGTYELKPGTTPLQLLDQMARGQFLQQTVTIIEGWNFRQMRRAIAEHPGLKHDTVSLSDKELMRRLGLEYGNPEGLFFPDTYRFAKGASDLQVYRQAHALMRKRLSEAWAKRSPSLPYGRPYEALVMASIIEKETGRQEDRAMVAAVFVNRLRIGMLLQTDPTVIYGMGDRYQGKIRKQDLKTDTPYNTYTRKGLPPTPIALAGAASLHAALHPADSDVLYFVARGNGSSQFSTNLADHNRAVNKYVRKISYP